MFSMLLLWGILFVVFVIVETVTTQLVSIWFAAGALAAFLTALFTDSIAIQLVVFLAVSVLLLLFTRPLLKRFIIPKIQKTNAADVLVGKHCKVVDTIDNSKGSGRIQDGGLQWNARNHIDDQPIAAGTMVEVMRIEGVTAYVTPLQ